MGGGVFVLIFWYSSKAIPMIEGLSWGDTGFADEFARATLLVIQLALASVAVGLVLGLFGAWGKFSRVRIANKAADFYTTFIRGMPELLVIWIVFFGVSILSQKVYTLIVGEEIYIEISAFLSGTIALGLVFGAFATEVFRGAFLAVPKGQVDAAHACGMSRAQTLIHIQMPQVIRYALPGLGNLWLVMLKDTALISVVALDEIMRTARIGSQVTHKPFTFYLAAAGLYLLLTTVSMVGIRFAERWSNRGVRKA